MWRTAWICPPSTPFLLFTVEFRSEESRGCLQDLIGAPKLTVVFLQFFEALRLRGGETRPLTLIDLGPSQPLPQGLRGHPQLGGDGGDGGPLGVVLALVLEHQADRPLRHINWMPRLSMTPILKGWSLDWSLDQGRGGSEDRLHCICTLVSHPAKGASFFSASDFKSDGCSLAVELPAVSQRPACAVGKAVSSL